MIFRGEKWSFQSELSTHAEAEAGGKSNNPSVMIGKKANVSIC